MLLHLCGPEAKQNSQLYSLAQSRDQASVLFDARPDDTHVAEAQRVR